MGASWNLSQTNHIHFVTTACSTRFSRPSLLRLAPCPRVSVASPRKRGPVFATPPRHAITRSEEDRSCVHVLEDQARTGIEGGSSNSFTSSNGSDGVGESQSLNFQNVETERPAAQPRSSEPDAFEAKEGNASHSDSMLPSSRTRAVDKAEEGQQDGKEDGSSDSESGFDAGEQWKNFAKIWALLVLSMTYVHQASSGFSVPVMLPMITTSLSLNDFQGALLTSGYSYLYALALIPMGLLADKVNRPKLLGIGTSLWSVLIGLSSQAQNFGDLMGTRVGIAAAQSSQNVICFSMIPELFPKNKSTALAVYNTAIYVGRGLMYFLLTNARMLLNPQAKEMMVEGGLGSTGMDASGNLLVPLDKLDLRLVQIMYTTGDIAAIRAINPFFGKDEVDWTEIFGEMGGLNEQIWREIMKWLTVPGLLLAAALVFSVPEAGARAAAAAPFDAPSLPASSPGSPSDDEGRSSSPASRGAFASGEALVPKAEESSESSASGLSVVWGFLKSPPFMATTVAAALNDVASYALVAWQSTFYERCFGMSTEQYAPMLATILPIAGILGGVGGGLLGDRLTLVGKRGYVTVGASLLAAPFIYFSLSANNASDSFLALGVGFALSESWRAPTAVMARSVATPETSSTAMSIYLSVRNIIGGLGPLIVAQLATNGDLRNALEILPFVYLLSGVTFGLAEFLLARMEQPVASK